MTLGRFARGSADETRAQTSFHADDTGREILEYADQRQALVLLARHKLALRIKSNKVTHVLADIDANCRHNACRFVGQWPMLLPMGVTLDHLASNQPATMA